MIKAVIFDRDGVLTYFDINAANQMLRSIMPIDAQELGHAWYERSKIVGLQKNVEEEQMLTNFWNYLTDRLSLTPAQYKWLSLFDYTSVLRPFPEARQTLRFVRARGLKVGILSNFGLASLDRSLKATNLFDLIDIACRAAVIGYAKPSPLAYQHITNALSVAPHECLFFDDEQSCVDGVRAVGMIAHLVDRENECIPLDHLVSDSFAAISTM